MKSPEESCGCVVVTTATGNLICLCPMHEAAPELLAACKALVTEAEDGDFGAMIPSTIWAIIEDDIKPAITRAEAPGSGED